MTFIVALQISQKHESVNNADVVDDEEPGLVMTTQN